MPQPRIHENCAKRQAAYMQRKRRSLARQSELATLARNLHAIIQSAVVRSTFPLPKDLAAATPDATLKNLIRFFDSKGDSDER
jgi:hypothetical protein